MDELSNREFLAAVFGPDNVDDAHVCGFDEDPGELEALGLRNRWAGNKWGRLTPAARDALDHQNAYFVISLFDDDIETGRALRRKALFRSCHVIVVDDVGTKVSPGRLMAMPMPSYVLETSPGNFQWGFVLNPVERDAARVAGLLKALIAGGIAADGSDPGMAGVTRYARLPVGRNTKKAYGGDWHCVLGVPGGMF